MQAIPNPELIDRLQAALKDLQYGSVQLIVHEGKIVRIERLERIRLTDSSETIENRSG